MAEMQIGVIDPSQSEKTNMQVPDNVEVGRLIEAMVEAMSLPVTGADGRPNRYQLNLRQPDGRLTRLEEGQTLAQNGVEQDATLQLTIEMVAGCFLPNTLVSVTTGKHVQIDTLRAGDSILSYDTQKQKFCSGTVSSIITDRCDSLGKTR